MRADDLAADLDRLVDRLRHLPDSRLARPPRGPGGSGLGGPPAATGDGPAPATASVADLAHGLAQRLADTARGIEGRDLARPPDPRPVPRLADLASGDVVAVTGRDVVIAARGVHADDPVWTGGARQPAAVAVATAATAIAALHAVL